MAESIRDLDSQVYTRDSLLLIIDSLPIAISVIRKDREVLLVNQAMAMFLKRDKSVLVGKAAGNAMSCVHHDDVPEGCGFGLDCENCILKSTINKTFSQNMPHPMVEVGMAFKGVGKKHLRISTLPIRLNNEPVVLFSMEDITKAKELEKTRLEKEKLSAVMETVGAVCHEINQPLMILQGLSEILLEDLPQDQEIAENLLRIKAQTERIGSITKKLRTITRYRTKPYLEGEIIDIDSASDS